MSDSETRKKLRESEYRVCELEFKMAEMADSYANMAAPVATPIGAFAPVEATSNEQPSPEYLAKLHEELASAKLLCEVLAQERDLARTSASAMETAPAHLAEATNDKTEPLAVASEPEQPITLAPDPEPEEKPSESVVETSEAHAPPEVDATV